MLASSTTIRSASRGWSRSKLGSPPGRSCSSRCTVVAGCPDSSVNRFAARPVGAANTIFARFAAARVITDLTVNDFPQPGPPVNTATRWVNARRTACSCSTANSAPLRARSHANALAQSTVPKPGIRSAEVVASRSRAAASAVSARWNGTRYTAGIVPPSLLGLGTGSRITPSAAARSARQARTRSGGTPRIWAASVTRFGPGR